MNFNNAFLILIKPVEKINPNSLSQKSAKMTRHLTAEAIYILMKFIVC